MTPEQIELVQRTWRAVLPVGDTAAELFYGKLFSLDPEVRRLFKNDMVEPGPQPHGHDQRRRRLAARSPSASRSRCASSASATPATASSAATSSWWHVAYLELDKVLARLSRPR
jgi:hypothetical protein